MERPAVAMPDQFIMKDFIHRMADLVDVIDVGVN